MSSSSFVIKAKLGDDLRRMTLSGPVESLSLSQLKSSLVSLFGVPSGHSLKLRYIDEDSDLITITSDIELREALLGSKANVLRIELEVVLNDADAAAAAAAVEAATPITSSASSFVSTTSAEVISSPIPQETSSFIETSESIPPQAESVDATQPEEPPVAQKNIAPEEEKQQPPPAIEDVLPPYDESLRVPPPPEKHQDAAELAHFLNEFHYHRILFQTAIESTFQSMKEDYDTHSKPKVDDFLHRVDLQRAALLEAVERTLAEWKEDISTSNAPQEFARHVSEALHEVGTLTTPIISQIRTSLSKLLQRLFRSNPEALTSSEIMRELDTFNASGSGSQDPHQSTPAQEDSPIAQGEPAAARLETEESCDLANPAPVKEDMPTLLTDIATEGDTTIISQSGEVKVPSELSDDFVYLDGYQQNQEAGTEERERAAQLVSETVWAEEFLYQQSLNELVSMGFADSEALRAALVANQGDISATLDSFL